MLDANYLFMDPLGHRRVPPAGLPLCLVRALTSSSCLLSPSPPLPLSVVSSFIHVRPSPCSVQRTFFPEPWQILQEEDRLLKKKKNKTRTYGALGGTHVPSAG